MSRFDAAAALEPLKDFQRATAEHVYRRLYADEDAVRRFLIADEVGLGKTLVARGVIAKAIEHLQDVVERVDVVYVCSNALIAKQNIQRLRVGTQEHFELAERITMLPATAHRLSANEINLVSFTPGTSFELTGGSGKAGERALLRLVLAELWGHEWFRSRGSMRVFQGGVQTLERFRGVYQQIAAAHGANLDPELLDKFAATLADHDAEQTAAGQPSMGERFVELCDIFARNRPVSGWSRSERAERNRLIGDLRDLLARACLDALRPDLIVLDEFQRFKHLLARPGSAESSPASELAHELFEHVDFDSGSQARVLLLSATPYKMLTRQADDDENHHEDLLETVRFLLEGDDDAVDELRRNLRGLRRGLLQAGRDGGAAARQARAAVESTLRRVMVRTERLAATPDRSGMLESRECNGLELDAGEVGRFVAGARLARDLGAPDPLEYWKSAPYLLNYAEHYRLREAFDEAADADPSRLAARARDAGVLPFERLRAFDTVPSQHPRMRWLTEDTVGRGAWKLLWIPPSLPYVEPSGAFADDEVAGLTKRLVFSSWTMVPTAITTLLTYEAERCMVSAGGQPRYRNSPEARQNLARLLEFTYSNDRLTGMPVLGMLYPSVALAEAGDPLELSRGRGGGPVPVGEALDTVAARLRERLRSLSARIEADGGYVPRAGREDERWYWAAPILLDWLAEPAYAEEMFASRRWLRDAFTGGESVAGGRFRQHIGHVRELLLGDDWPAMEAMPTDLPDVLARMALAAPGVVAARALARATGRRVDELQTRRAACRVAWGFRTLFNNPEVTELIRHLHPGEPYWQRTIEYALAGNLQAVLDEYAHILVTALGHLDPRGDKVLDDLAKVIHDTVSLRTVRYGVSRIDINDGQISVRPDKLRANFALRLSNERNDDGSQTRLGDVREAFNSPFRPFVLATTSAGQEGLDFHPYCHAVVHWNLPSNPVDLEQREGRVHRFQGHAIRRNVADAYATLGRTSAGDPWQDMFTAAHADRSEEHTDIVPYWIYTNGTAGDTSVYRYVPALPLSRDRSRTQALQRAVASYRLAFGQPRQDDLLAYLAETIDPETLERLTGELRIDLGPP